MNTGIELDHTAIYTDFKKEMWDISDGECELISRRKNFCKRFGLLCEAMAGLKVESAILDSEIVCLDSEGRSVFYELLFKCLTAKTGDSFHCQRERD